MVIHHMTGKALIKLFFATPYDSKGLNQTDFFPKPYVCKSNSFDQTDFFPTPYDSKSDSFDQ